MYGFTDVVCVCDDDDDGGGGAERSGVPWRELRPQRRRALPPAAARPYLTPDKEKVKRTEEENVGKENTNAKKIHKIEGVVVGG
jgi:hypothetical protein